MAHETDIVLKFLFGRPGHGELRRLLFKGQMVAEQLSTEQPQVANRSADMLARTANGELHQIEFQSTNEVDFGLRMLDYWVYFRKQYRRPVHQVVLYTGAQPMRLNAFFQEGETSHRFEIVNLRALDAGHLLTSDDWADNVFALAAQGGDVSTNLGVVLKKMAGLTNPERQTALAALTAFSGILKIDGLLKSKLEEREFSMIDVKFEDNAVVRPLIERGEQRGRELGQREMLIALLEDKFGPLADSTRTLIQDASTADLERWARRTLRSNSLDEVWLG